jgi:hypothetical protein
VSEPWRLCAPCGVEWSRWLDTRPSTLIPRGGFAHGSGAAYDVSAAGIRDGRRARHEEWRRTVRHAQGLVSEGCRTGRHAGVDTSQSSL